MPINPTQFKITLVKTVANSDKETYWTINSQDKTIQTSIKTLASGTDSQDNGEIQKTAQDYSSTPLARYHVYKEILEKRKEGYQLPNRISMNELLNIKPTPADKVDYYLESDHYENFIVIDGDIYLDYLDIDALHNKTGGLIIQGDLFVDGGIYNTEGDYGSALIVKGKVVADFLIGGGSEILISDDDSYIHSVIFGHYNHGILHTSGSTLVLIDSDHNLWLKGKAYFKYDVYEDFEGDELGQFPGLGEILKSDFSDLLDKNWFKDDDFMTLLIENKQRTLLLLKAILDANFADDADITSVMKDGLAIQKINDPSEEVQLAAVKQNGMALEYINNPNEKVTLAAVSENPYAMEFVHNPSKAIQFSAIKNLSYGAGVALQYIKQPSVELLRLAVSIDDGSAIEYIENPSEELQLLAVKQDYSALEYIKNPSAKVQMAAVAAHGKSIRYIKNPSEELQLIAVKQDGSAISAIHQPSEAVKLAAVKQAGWSITYIQDPSEELQIEAIKQTYKDFTNSAIQYIKNPTESAQLLSVGFNGDNIEYIKNPSEAVKQKRQYN